MKILGKINIGNLIIQVDKISNDFSLKAPIGTYLFADPLCVYEKTGKSDSDWTKSTYKMMLSNMLTWSTTMLDSTPQDRKEMVDLIFDSILNYKDGEPSEQGQEAVDYLKNHCKLIGFAPATSYIMHKERGEGSLEVFWEHPFSMPALLFKDKELPFLIISHGNIEFDNSKLIKIFDKAQSGKLKVEGLGDDDEIDKPQSGLGILA